MSPGWQAAREVFTIIFGAALVVVGASRSDSAMMVVGGGLIGWSPAAKGP